MIQRVAAGFSGRSGEGREKVESDGVLSNGELSHSGSGSALMTECIPSILSFGNGLGSEEVACQTALVRRVLCSSQENMDFVCEVFRQAMLLPISEIIVMRSVLKVYQEWIENEQKPPFVCDNDTDSLGGAVVFFGATFEEDTETFEKEASGHEVESAEKDKEIELKIVEKERKVSHSWRHSSGSSLGRSGSYQKAINPLSQEKEPTVNFQTFLQVILTHSTNVFLLEPSYEMSRLLNDQVDLCKRVLSIYRHMIMQTSMEQRTWEQLLHVLLGITENIFHHLPSEVPMQSTLAGHLASPIFQTLIVASIRASLSIPVSHKLWDRLLLALSSLTHWPELITEWTKTMETLTKVLARQVYGLDLTDLPLNKIGENRLKKQRSKALRSDAKSTSLDRSFSKSWSHEQFRQGFSRNVGMTTETSLHSQRAKNSVPDMHTPPAQDDFHDDSHVGWSSEENRVPSDEHQDLWHSSSACDLQQVHQAEVNIQCDVIRPEQHQTGSLLLDPMQSENTMGHITVEDGYEKLNTSIDAWQTSQTRDDFERSQDLGLSSATSAFNIGGGGTHEEREKESLSMFPLEPSGFMTNQHCYRSVGGDDPMSFSDVLAMFHNKGTENIIVSKGGPYGVGMEKTAGHNVHHKSEELEYGNLGVATTESETMTPSRQIGIDVVVTPGSESASLTYSESSHSPAPSLDGEISQVKDSLAALDESLTSSVLHLHDITDGETGCKTSSVMMGGAAVGWNAEVAWVLWKRVLGLLGDVNNIKDSEIHAQVFEYLCDLWETLVQIRDNLGVSTDNQTTPPPPNLIPPLTLLIPWLLKATRLPKSHRKGQMLAHRLLCKMMSSRQHALISTDLSIHLYSTLHSALLSHDQKLVSEVVKHCSPCFWAFTLPASSILVWDVLWAASCVATYPLPWAPHAEAQTLLGALVCLPNLYESMPVLHPTAGDVVPTDCEGLKDELVKLIISAAKEHSECARCVAISSLGIWLCEELVEATNHPKILESFQVICSTLLDSNRAVAQVACDVMNTLLYYAEQLQQYQPDLSRTAVKEIASSITCLLSTAESSNCEDDKKFLASLVSTLVDWCMAVPRSTLLSESNIKEFGTRTQSSLLCFVFKVLYACVYGSHMLTWYEYACSTSWMGSGFSCPSSYSIDHRRPSLPAKTMNSAEVPRGLLVHAGRAAVTHLLTLLEHFPLADGGPALQDSLLSEQSLSKENETQRTETLESPHMQIFVLTNGSRVDTLLSVMELTQSTDINRDDLLMKERLGLMTSGARTGSICATSDVFSSESHPPSSAAIVDSLLRPCHHRVRLLTRDASGKHVWDAVRLFGPAHAEGTFFPTTLLIPPCVKHECSTRVNDENRQNIPENVWQLDEPVVAQDDVLDDLLQYIGSSSPECLPYGPGVALHKPAPETHPHFSAQDEQALIETLERQCQAEHEWNIGQSADPPEDWTESQTISLQHEDTLSPFLYARILLSDLGLLEWNKKE
uniref:Ral GTPase-activating protein subunit alpha/beta N-terminal domain-containing protein n=1 Tax=Eptatretus burgeri TaxID=7764 RepID=A0A8C4QUH9_EPTBU